MNDPTRAAGEAARPAWELPREWPNPGRQPDFVFLSPYLDVLAYGVRLLSSVLRRRGFSTRLIFLPDLGPLTRYELDFRRRYPPEVLDQVAELCRGVPFAGISLMSNNFAQAVQLSEHLRQRTSCSVVWGGVHPTVRPEESLEHADYACLGEAEEALPELLRLHREGRDPAEAPNFCSRREGRRRRNALLPLVQDLDGLPLQDFTMEEHYTLDTAGREIVPLDEPLFRRMVETGIRLGAGKTVFQIMPTRGCPHACTYCYNSWFRALYKGQEVVRRRSVENAVHEMEHFRRRFPFVELLALTDDSFLAGDEAWLERFADEYRRRVGLPLFCLVSPATLSERKLELLLDAGLHAVEMGIQSGCDAALRRYNRPSGNEEVLRAAGILSRQAGRLCPPIYDLLLDDPLGGSEEVLDTLKLLRRLPRPYVLHVFSLTLFPGTVIYKRALRDGLLEEGELERRVYEKVAMHPTDRYPHILVKLFNRRFVPPWLPAVLACRPLRLLFDRPWFPRAVGRVRRLGRRLGLRSLKPATVD